MGALTEQRDWSCLVGRELLSFGIGANELIFYLDADTRINVESPVILLGVGEQAVVIDDPRNADHRLFRLIGACVERVELMSDLMLDVILSSGATIRLAGSGGEYESFHISWPGGQIVVW